jgi:neutral ceramidase
VQMARRVRAQILDSPANAGPDGRSVVDRAIVVGLANDYLGYLTTPEEYSAQAYEGTFTFFGPQQGPYVADRVQALSDALLRGEEVPLSFPPPDTSFTRTDNVSPVTQALSTVTDGGTAAGTSLEEPAKDVVRGDVAAFTWAGGQPSAEVQPGEVFVTFERHDRGWHTVEDDADLGTIVRHFRDRLDDRWTAEWDVPFDAPAGHYRFRVTGYSYDGGTLVPYEVASRPFTVSRSDGLVVESAEASAGRVVVTAGYPPAHSDRSFRLRPDVVTSGVVSVVVRHADGTTSQGSGGYVPEAGAFVVDVPAAAPGDVVDVPAGALVDAAGNTNG